MAVLFAVGWSGQALAQNCAAQAPASALGERLAGIALQEFVRFNGHRVNADGLLWRFGSTEAETELLHDPHTGKEDAGQPGRLAWRRVWEYWLALDRHVEDEALSRKLVYVPGLASDGDSGERMREMRLKDLFQRLDQGNQQMGYVMKEAAIRAAITDTPWSATFISFLMDQAGLSDAQFRYSSTHWDYIRDALRPNPGYAYRACDPLTTRPSVGDLICYSRGARPLDGFRQWQQAGEEGKASVPAHCDLVVAVDRQAKKMEVVGGNVFQSVTRRRLKLNRSDVLSSSHLAARQPAKWACRSDAQCERSDLNLQYWGVLLQLQQSAR